MMLKVSQHLRSLQSQRSHKMLRICSDSTCDLSDEIVKQYGITVIPLHIVLDDKEYRDRIEITQEEIFEWADKNKTTPKTSAVSVTDAEAAIKPMLDAGDELVIFTISESMSTTANVFRMVAEDLDAVDRVHVVGSDNLSTGIGLLVVEAALMAQNGLNASQILDEVKRLKPKVRASFVIDTLTYLARGGRCSSVAALAGGILRIHPKIIVKDGRMEVSKKYRGQMRAVVMDYVRDMHHALLGARPQRVFITHTCQDHSIVDEVRA